MWQRKNPAVDLVAVKVMITHSVYIIITIMIRMHTNKIKRETTQKVRTV